MVGISDNSIAQLNRAHLGHRGPTDVLTFDLSDGAAQIDGQIAISLDTARKEAARRGHPISSEAALYAVHGVLHLLGYDDRSSSQAKQMHRAEDEILRSLGRKAVYARRAKVTRR